MILRFSTITKEGKPAGIAFNSDTEMYSKAKWIYMEGIHSIPISETNIQHIEKECLFNNYGYTADKAEFFGYAEDIEDDEYDLPFC